MRMSPDQLVFWEWVRWGPFTLNATILFTWGVMALLAVGSWLVTRRLRSAEHMSRWQNLLEVIVDGMRKQIREISQQDARRYLPFVGTLFLFIAVSSLLMIVPGYQAPTGSLSTTAALALCVLVAVPAYGIAEIGLWAYLKTYAQPSIFMLPFNVIGEVSRTIALAVRLFGNVMSGALIAAILVSIVPFLVPAVMNAFGLLTGMIQAYIFAVLAMVYIASATRARGKQKEGPEPQLKGKGEGSDG